jgi:hypothetical protein
MTFMYEDIVVKEKEYTQPCMTPENGAAVLLETGVEGVIASMKNMQFL